MTVSPSNLAHPPKSTDQNGSGALILLFGSNPLPPILAALHHGNGYEIHVISSEQVKDRTIRALEWLKTKGFTLGQTKYLPDVQSPSKIQAELGSFFRDYPGDLHYSGATKALAVHAHRLWSEANVQKQARASWLSSNGMLHFDNPNLNDVDLRFEPQVCFEDLWSFHRNDTPKWSDEHLKDRPRKLANKIAELHQADIENYRKCLPKLYEVNKNEHLKLELPDMAAEGSICLKPSKLDLADKANFNDGSPLLKNTKALHEMLFGTDGTFDHICQYLKEALPKTHQGRREQRLSVAKWLYGEWLEVWLADKLRNLKETDEPRSRLLFDEVRQDVKVGGNDGALQLDVVAVRGHRSFLFSCTVDHHKALVKSKFMEASIRAKQLGGDLARFAIVSFYKNDTSILDEVRADGFNGYGDARSFEWKHFMSEEIFNSELRDWVLK